jgi:UDP-3-O-[3-hydroxymyristoyl] glucosamine N-acyltransferase
MTDPVFFEPSRRFTAGDIATLTGAELRTPDMAGNQVARLAALNDGGVEALVFVEGRKNAANLHRVNASALLCTADLAGEAPPGAAVLVSKRPQHDFALVGRLMFPSSARPGALTGETGISAAAHVDPSALIEDDVIIEAGAVIGSRVAIGRGTVVAPNAVIGASCQIGRECHVGPGAVVQHALIGNRVIIHAGARIGQDGFGFVAGRGGPEKMPQVGRVVIQDDVEIGANTTIDRGALSDTVIGDLTKIDNLVQIGHNVRIGRACLIAGQCGLSGSVTLGDGVLLGGGAGLSDHISIGSGAQIAARSGVMNDVPAGERWGGAPAQPIRDAMREFAAVRALARSHRDKWRQDG